MGDIYGIDDVGRNAFMPCERQLFDKCNVPTGWQIAIVSFPVFFPMHIAATFAEWITLTDETTKARA